MKRPRRGATLVDALTCCALLSLLFGMVALVCQLGYQSSLVVQNAVELQNSATAAVASVITELQGAHVGSVVVLRNPDALIFLSPRDANGQVHFDTRTDELLWQRWVCYWFDTSQGALIELAQDIVPSTTAPTAAPTLPSFQGLPTRRVVAWHMVSFVPLYLSASHVVSVSATFQQVGAGGAIAKDMLALTDEVALQN